MFMSVLVVLNPDASAGFRLSALDRCGGNDEFRSAVAPHLPSGIAVLIDSGILQEGKAVDLLTCEVYEVVCVCHARRELLIRLLLS